MIARPLLFCFIALLALPLCAEDNEAIVFPYGYQLARMDANTFATVAGSAISMQALEQSLRQAVREKFYHRQPSNAQRYAMRDSVATELIDERLLFVAARMRGLKVDSDTPKQVIIASLLSGLDAEDYLLPSEEALVLFYDKQHAKFTRPSRQKVSLILLGVQPSAASEEWQAAYDVAETLYKRIKQGESFSVLAQQYSSHESAPKGGDLGFIHKGMLIDKLQAVVDHLPLGGVSKPAWTLQGIVLFRLVERTEARLAAFESVKSRVQKLWQRARKKQLERGLMADFRKKFASKVVVNQLIFD